MSDAREKAKRLWAKLLHARHQPWDSEALDEAILPIMAHEIERACAEARADAFLEAAKMADNVLGDLKFLASPADHGDPCEYCLGDALRARAKGEADRG